MLSTALRLVTASITASFGTPTSACLAVTDVIVVTGLWVFVCWLIPHVGQTLFSLLIGYACKRRSFCRLVRRAWRRGRAARGTLGWAQWIAFERPWILTRVVLPLIVAVKLNDASAILLRTIGVYDGTFGSFLMHRAAPSLACLVSS